MKYLVIINKNSGERITSFAMNVHGSTWEELHNAANKDYADALQIEDETGEIHHGFGDDKIYLNDKFVERPVIPPTKAELQEQALKALDVKYTPIFADYEEQIMKAELVYKDTEWADELREALQAKKDEYTAEREVIVNGN